MTTFKVIVLAALLSVTASQSFSQELPKSEVNGSLKDECKKMLADLESQFAYDYEDTLEVSGDQQLKMVNNRGTLYSHLYNHGLVDLYAKLCKTK